MMNLKRLRIYLLIILNVLIVSIHAQDVNTLYFINDFPLRHEFNPAFQPTTKYYVSFPLLGDLFLNLGNNSVRAKDLIYKNQGQTIRFFDQGGNIDALYNKLKPTIFINGEVNIDILSFGIKSNWSAWNFSIRQRFESQTYLPKDIFSLALYGTPNINATTYNLNALTDNNYYTEFSLGYSYRLNNQWTLGAKLKYLYGTANVSLLNNITALTTGASQWSVNSHGTLNYAGNMNSFSDFFYNGILKINPPAGNGAGIDLGAQFKANDKLILSASLTDLGFILWNKENVNQNYGLNYTFNGVTSINSSMSFTEMQNVIQKLSQPGYLVDSITNTVMNNLTINQTSKSFMSYTTAKINLGAQYFFIPQKLSAGLLVREILYKNALLSEATASINAKPINWLNTSLSYSLVNGRNTFGAGIGIRAGFIYLHAAMDYIPFDYIVPVSVNLPFSKLNFIVPYDRNYFNLSLGINFVFGKKHNAKSRDPRTGLYNWDLDNSGCNCDYN